MAESSKQTRISFDHITIVEGVKNIKPENIWISHVDGEAGEFSREKLDKILAKFFTKHFLT